MKKIGILNKDISEVVAGMGHYQWLVVCDAGFPIPEGVRRIDLALEEGYPGFLKTVGVVLKELQVEQMYIARETLERSPGMYQEMTAMFPDIKPELVSHDDFKQMAREAKACIRTGECTPYSNIILVSGVTY